MEQAQPGLVELLDRVLDRGLVVNADIIIALAGVPLIGITLRAALAGMETMARYGLLREWDQDLRGGPVETGAQAAAVCQPGVSLKGQREEAWRGP